MSTELQSPLQYYRDRREKELIQRLLKPIEGERLLDVGCGSGNHFRFFRGKGCNVTGVDPSQHMLDRARKNLGERAELCPGDYEDLPFSDNEFDIVTLIFPDSACNLQNAINEAIRVCRGRIFFGTINRFSSTSTYGMEKVTLYRNAHRSSIPELIRLIRLALPDTIIEWGSVIFFSSKWHPAISSIEEKIPVMKNPFGSFIGLAFPVTYNRITVQDPLGNASKAKAKGGYPEPGVARRRTGR
ncbi:MAG: methyltransferase domain-containing protein [Deltaproteobacteria bacterium]|nr:methyltransferase domain-containing protein [Deltaproteobacteria bacterium]